MFHVHALVFNLATMQRDIVCIAQFDDIDSALRCARFQHLAQDDHESDCIASNESFVRDHYKVIDSTGRVVALVK